MCGRHFTHCPLLPTSSRQLDADRRKGLTETDYARLLDAAHQQLGGPIVVVWDYMNTHVSRAITGLIAAPMTKDL
jgi:hypothetical protein